MGSERCWRREKVLPWSEYRLLTYLFPGHWLSWSGSSSLAWAKSLYLKLLREELPKCPNSVHRVSKDLLGSGQQHWLQYPTTKRQLQKNSVSGRIFYSSFKKKYLIVFLTERKGEGSKFRNMDERETSISCLLHTSYCECAWNQGTCPWPKSIWELSVRRPMLYPLSQTGFSQN